ncbi:hypothetical protein HDU91_000885 [Kappamyces sp. JEL0680]|nr:hypothetical protein HDU91_000885 [Kappamyces sp. JEL0680]
MNLFSIDHMPYDIDRDETKLPSLAEMASRALALLTKASQEKRTGFFLMIEGSRIDMAAHSNDPAAHIHEILAYNAAIEQAKQYVDAHPGTILISTSDHETGGLSVGHQLGATYPIYAWSPEELFPVRHSGEYIAVQLLTQTAFERKPFVNDILFKKWLGISDPLPSDVAFMMNATEQTEVEYRIGQIMSDRAMVGWQVPDAANPRATHGHSAVDVNLYAYGAQSHELRGNHENTEIGDFVARHLGLDLHDITKRLQQ